MQRKSKAQVSLEYMSTYAWALVIIAIIAGILFFVVTPPAEEMRVKTSSTRFLLQHHAVDPVARTFTMTVQNNTGTVVSVSSISPDPVLTVTDSPDPSETFKNGESFEITGTFEDEYSDNGSLTVSYSSQGYTKNERVEFHGPLPPAPPVAEFTCGDLTCEDGENCPGMPPVGDDWDCDLICYTGTCTNGCQYTPISDGQEDLMKCDDDEGCATPPCTCDGAGNCVPGEGSGW